MHKELYDVIIVGAGVSGAAIARELSRYEGRFLVLEREEDVCAGTSKANSGIVHAGHDAKNGTLKAKMNVRGNELMGKLSEDLDIPFIRNGSLVVCTDEEDMEKLENLYENGCKNGVPGLRLLSKEEVRKMEPNITENVTAALYAPTGGIICPFELNIALAENACVNGVEFLFDAEVKEISKTRDGYQVVTEECVYETKAVVNAAGVFADQIHNMISSQKLHITPRRGEYMLLDKSAGTHVKQTIFNVPGKYGKGVLVTPTVHGNLLVGPTAMDIEDKEGTDTTADGLKQIREKCMHSVSNIPLNEVITSFAGLRAHEDGRDFVIEESEAGFFDCAGIASPGLSSCPAIGELVAGMAVEYLKLDKKQNFISQRKGILRPDTLSDEERNKLVEQKPAYGNIICRCEMITEGEILDAIHRPIGAKSLDGIKRRTRAGMGRCQSGFCSPRVMEILARESGMDLSDVTKSGRKSYMITGKNKEGLQEA